MTWDTFYHNAARRQGTLESWFALTSMDRKTRISVAVADAAKRWPKGVSMTDDAFRIELLPPLPEHLAASGEFRERSRESVDQLTADRRLCREIEARCEGRPVVAKWPYVMMLAEPRFGYVSKPVADLRCAGILPRDLPQVQAYDPASPPADAFYILAWNSFEFFSEFGPPRAFGPEDEVVFSERDRRGGHQEVVFVYRRKL